MQMRLLEVLFIALALSFAAAQTPAPPTPTPTPTATPTAAPTVTPTTPPTPAPVSLPTWTFAGPRGSRADNSSMTVSSAAHVAVKTSIGFLLGTVNGGVWLTRDSVTNERARWVNVFDTSNIPCSSITVLSLAPGNASRVYAGCGSSTSGQMGYSWRIRSEGPWLGFAVSHDGGLTWTLCRGFPIFQSVSAIVEMPTGELLVGVRGPFVGPQNDGGVYRASSYLKVQDSTDWQRTLSGVAISSVVLDPVSSTLFASTVATSTAANVVITSQDRGLTWVNLSANAQLQLSGAPLFVPFYSTLTIVPGQTLFLLVLLAPSIWLDLGGLGGGNGQVFYLNLSNATASWQVVGGQPAFANPQNPNMDCVYDCKTTDRCCWTLDQDYSAKDYAAIMVDPRNSSILYVAANAGFLAYRVDWRRALNQGMCTYNSSSSNALTVCYNTSIDLYLWTPMWSQSGFVPDTIDNQVPHGDCRNFAWDTDSDSLLLLSDGGVAVRFKPESKGQGYWRGWSGDIGTMELVSVSYDAVSDRFVGAAQDNDCQLSVFGITTPGRNVLPTLSFNLGCLDVRHPIF